MTTIDIQTGSNLALFIKDYVLMDFIFKFVVIFGVGFLIASKSIRK